MKSNPITQLSNELITLIKRLHLVITNQLSYDIEQLGQSIVWKSEEIQELTQAMKPQSKLLEDKHE